MENGKTEFRLGLEYFVHHRTGPEMSWAEADKTADAGKTFFRADMSQKVGPAARLAEEALETRHRETWRPRCRPGLEEVLSRDAAETGEGYRTGKSILPGGRKEWPLTVWANGKNILTRTSF